MRRLAPRRFLASTLLLAAGCVSSGTSQELPEEGFLFYTGTDEVAGELMVAVTELRREADGRVAVLVPMIHIAEPSFYRAVQEEMDQGDVVLLEGVGGSSTLSPTKLFTTYLFSNYPRFAAHAGLAEQRHVMQPRENQRSADLTRAEFSAQMPWYTPLVHAVMLPVVAAVAETWHALAWTGHGLSRLAFAADSFEASFRHGFFDALDDDEDDDEDDLLLPGVIVRRNERLLAALEAATAEPGALRIVVPWGAAHMAGLVAELEPRGFAVASRRWVRAARVAGWEDAPDDERPFSFWIPYALHIRALDGAWTVSLLFQSIVVEQLPQDDHRIELLWEWLASWRGDVALDRGHLQVLPSFFERPLLFRWSADGAARRLQFLLFCDVEWTAGG